MRVQFASLKMDLAYNQEKSVIIRRFPTEYETNELKKSKYKLVDEEVMTSDNQLELKMFHNPRRKNVTVKSGGLYDFKEGGTYGVDIDIKIKHAEKEIIDYLCNVMRELCGRHLKKAIVLPSRHSVACQIDGCKLTNQKVKLFLEDFVKSLEGKIAEFEVTSKEEDMQRDADKEVSKIEGKLDEFVCSDCGGKFRYSDRENWFDKDKEEVITVCPECWSKRRQTKRDLVSTNENVQYNDIEPRKISKGYKIAIVVLSIIAIISILLVLDTIGII